MTSVVPHCAALMSLSLFLAACQNAPPQAESAQAVPAQTVEPSAQEQFEASLAAKRLTEAEAQLERLIQGDTESAQFQQSRRRLADAYLREGQISLEAGDLDQAAKSLSHARSLMPKAPALTTGLDGAIGKAQELELNAAEQARQADRQALAARQERLRLLRQAAEAQAAATREPAPATREAPSTPPPRVVSLAMLDNRDHDALLAQLEAAAVQIVRLDRRAHLEVRSAQDLRRVSALLEALVLKQDPAYRLRLSSALRPAQVPRLELEP
jgi:hypothetical protein